MCALTPLVMSAHLQQGYIVSLGDKEKKKNVGNAHLAEDFGVFSWLMG